MKADRFPNGYNLARFGDHWYVTHAALERLQRLGPITALTIGLWVSGIKEQLFIPGDGTFTIVYGTIPLVISRTDRTYRVDAVA